jgi:hypothetical protein
LSFFFLLVSINSVNKERSTTGILSTHVFSIVEQNPRSALFVDRGVNSAHSVPHYMTIAAADDKSGSSFSPRALPRAYHKELVVVP